MQKKKKIFKMSSYKNSVCQRRRNCLEQNNSIFYQDNNSSQINKDSHMSVAYVEGEKSQTSFTTSLLNSTESTSSLRSALQSPPNDLLCQIPQKEESIFDCLYSLDQSSSPLSYNYWNRFQNPLKSNLNLPEAELTPVTPTTIKKDIPPSNAAQVKCNFPNIVFYIKKMLLSYCKKYLKKLLRGAHLDLQKFMDQCMKEITKNNSIQNVILFFQSLEEEWIKKLFEVLFQKISRKRYMIYALRDGKMKNLQSYIRTKNTKVMYLLKMMPQQ